MKRARESRDFLHKELLKEKKAHYKLSQKETEIAELKTQLERANQPNAPQGNRHTFY